MLVTPRDFDKVIETLKTKSIFSLDSETTGLNPFNGDRLFSIIISTAEEDYYFNYNLGDHKETYSPLIVLDKKTIPHLIYSIDKIENLVYLHNAKFDLKFLLLETCVIRYATVFCTQAMARLVNNQLNSYSLDALGKLIGWEKDSSVKKYISKHKLYTLVDNGKKTPKKNLHFNLVPLDLIVKYGERDGRVTYELGEFLRKRLREIDKVNISLGVAPVSALVEQEIKLTKVLLDMEVRGIKINKEYTKEAHDYYINQCNEIEEKFYSLVGIDFQDSPKVLKEAFNILGLEHGVTEKGNSSFSAENLPDNTLGSLIKAWRKAYKFSGTYYRNFLDICDKNDVIHTSFKQGGTSTGRMSCVEPNLQNVPKRGEDKNPFPVRKCFTPREGCVFAMIDFDQMEYRLLLDLAGEQGIINKILKDGLDVHDATGEGMGVDRSHAKTLNFMLLYGGGAAKLAAALEVTLQKAKSLKAKYFSTLTKVISLVKKLISKADSRGYVVNIFGRKLLKPSIGSYPIPNHFIQGACGDIVKQAMIEIHNFLNSRKYSTKMLLQIHDEILLEVPKNELDILPELVKIMETTYKYKRLPLTAGCDIGENNWHEKTPYKGVE